MSFSDRYFKAHKRAKAPKAVETCPLCKTECELIQDHCHTTGLNRDRICSRCNNLLGRIEWQPANIETYLEYIERWRWEHSHGGTPYQITGEKQGQNSREVH